MVYFYPFVDKSNFILDTDLIIFFICCSGMPECKLGLNDRVLLEAQGRTTKGKAIDLDDIKFHQYVALYSLLIYLLLHQFFTFLVMIHCYPVYQPLYDSYNVTAASYAYNL